MSETTLERRVVAPSMDAFADMRQTDPAVIEEQINAGLAEGTPSDFLNNFENRLPGSDDWVRRKNENYRDIYDEPRYYDDEIDDRMRAVHSERYLTEPMGTILDETLDVIKNTPGIDSERLYELRDAFFAAKENAPYDPATNDARDAYLGSALDVYAELRKRGYTHADLWK